MDPKPVTAIREQILANYDGHVDRIQRAIQQPSVSVNHHGLEDMADLALEYLGELGCDESELVETGGAPGVWGYYDAGAEKTIINYGMLDTRPIGDRDEWDYPPFGAEIVERDPFGEVITGRGSVKVKGPFVAWLNALIATKHALGELPVNIMFLLEVEEINGSPYYYEMVEKYEDRLASGDAVLSPLASQNEDGDVVTALGYKSAIYFDLKVSGDRWGRGPQGGSVHAMSNAVVDSPAWHLIGALSCITSNDGTEVEIDQFYDQYEPPNRKEREEVSDFIEDLDGEDDLWRSLPGLTRGAGKVNVLKNDGHEDVEEAFLRYFYGPESINLQGVNCGYLGPDTGTKPFIVPTEGRATIDLRMPRGFDPSVTLDQLRGHLDANGYEDVEIDVSGVHPWSKTDRDSDLVSAVETVLERREVDITIWPYSAGGVPWSVFGNRFDVPVLYDVGLGYGDNYEGPNEFFVLEGTDTVAGLIDCELSHAEMLLTYAEQ